MQTTVGTPRGARVFVVDDDAAMRMLVGRIMSVEGHDPVLFNSPILALNAMQSGIAVDVLVTDLDLGTNMTGLDLAREARLIHPGLPVLLITGDPDAPASVDVSATVMKPFRLQELATALRACLAED